MRKRIARLGAGASGNYIVDGLMELVGSLLDAFEIIPQSAGHSLLESVSLLGVLCHAKIWRLYALNLPFCNSGSLTA